MPQILTAAFAALLRHHRLAQGLTQGALADRARISRRSVSDLERGEKLSPHLYTVEHLAEALGLIGQQREVFLAAARAHDVDLRANLPLGTPITLNALLPDPAATAIPYIGHQAELTRLHHLLQGPHQRLGLISGEAGIGKSRLLFEVGARAHGLGWRVVTGICARRFAPEPYAPFPQLLLNEARQTAPARRRQDFAGCADLTHLAPELAALGIGKTVDMPPSAQQRRVLTTALRRYLGQAAGPAGTLLLIDDLHWASPDTLDLLADLLQHADVTPPLRCIVAYRASDLSLASPCRRWLAEREMADTTCTVRLGALSPTESEQLFAAALPTSSPAALADDRRAEMLRQAEGVPFFLLSFAHEPSAAHGSELTPAEFQGAGAKLPAAIAQQLRERLHRLAATTRTVLALMALAEVRLSLTHLTRAVEQTASSVLRALEQAAAADLLVQQDGQLRFAHDLIRAAIHSGLSMPRQDWLHQRIALALEQDPPAESAAHAAALAHHFVQGGLPDHALPFALLAGDQAEAVFAHAEAERWYQLALALAEATNAEQQIAEAALKLGNVSLFMGKFTAAIDLFYQSLSLYRKLQDMQGIGNAITLIGFFFIFVSPLDGIQPLQQFAKEIELAASLPIVLTIHSALAYCYIFAARYREGAAVARYARELPDAQALGRAYGRVSIAYGMALLWLGQVREAQKVLEEHMTMLDYVEDFIYRGNALYVLRYCHEFQGDFHRANERIEQAVQYSEETDLFQARFFIYQERARHRILVGRWNEAREDLEQSIIAARGMWFERFPLIWLGYLSQLQGETQLADYYQKYGLVRQENGPVIRFNRELVNLDAMLLLQLEQPAQAQARILAHLQQLPDLEGVETLECLGHLAEAHLQQDHLTEAAELLERVIAQAHQMPHLLVLVDALRVRAQLFIREQQWEAAAADLDEGIALTRPMPYPYAEARLLTVAGQLHQERGEMEIACERLLAARAICEQLGEHLLRGQIDARLAALNGGATA